ncbi:hypothetical protein HNQ74_000479 [Bartonella doshiae]|uniref:hypothetical protein n=1 Tax=Bartonella doshiae TaxID=33044 RepID=UPI0002DC5360|nr:hypothetical protein [Bartonella doshiae]MBB6159066.1 hypothetical protein [Bartonella doshiae]
MTIAFAKSDHSGTKITATFSFYDDICFLHIVKPNVEILISLGLMMVNFCFVMVNMKPINEIL